MRDSLTTVPRSAESGPAVGRAPWLFAVFNADAPCHPSARHRLSGLDEVSFGRAGAARWRRTGKALALRLDDVRASSAHARLERVLHQWFIEDVGSRNGTLVNGAPVSRAALLDGDLIELGHSFFFFRELDSSDGEAPDREVDDEADRLGLSTLRPDLERELARLRLAAVSRETIMIMGESGSGKELAARAVHALSRRPGPLVPVNCGAIVESMVEAELFGHRRGAFSGATSDRLGFFRAADRGTLFLDEIGDLKLGSQAVLLRALQEQEVVPVGGEQAVRVDTRVVCATHRALAQLVSEGKFREDLLARLRGFELGLPPLRARREDLGLIVATLLRKLAGRDASRVKLSAGAARALLLAGWPQNVRELEKALGTALALAAGGVIRKEHLPATGPSFGAAEPPKPSSTHSASMDRERLTALLREHHGNVAAVARAMNKAPAQIHRWMKRFGLDPNAYRT